MNYKEFKQYVDKTNKNIADKLKDNEEELAFYINLVKRFNDICEENEKLKKQLEYLRSGEYYNQLRFENEMLQKVVDTNGVPSEVYDFLESVHKNTEFLEQQQEFIKYLEDGIDICDGFLDTVKSDLQEIPYGVISANENITTRIKENETAHKVYEKILQKYKEIIGTDTNVGSKGE